MSNEREKIGIDVWMAGTIYVDAETEEEAAQIVKERYAGTREKPNTYDHMNSEDLPLDGDGFMSSAMTLYGISAKSTLVPAVDDVPTLLHAAKAFDLSSWLSSGALTSPRTDGLLVNLSIEGTSYEAAVTVGQIRALSEAIAEAEGRTNG